MKRLIGLIGLLVPVLVSVWLFYIDREKPDVIYSLSENIPFNFEEESSNNVQQVKIRNIGRASANNVKLKINGKVNEYRIIKDSEQDRIKEFQKPNTFELVYTDLPPDSEFLLVVKSGLKELSNGVLTVKSDNGLARNVLDNQKRPALYYLYIAVMAFYIVAALMTLKKSFRHFKIDSLLLTSAYDIKKISEKKPFYFNSKEWENLLVGFAKLKMTDDLTDSFFNNIERTASCYILKIERNQDISEDGWASIVAQAKKIFLKLVDNKLMSSYDDNAIIEFLAKVIDLSKDFDEPLQIELGGKVSKGFIEYKKFRTTRYLSPSSVNKEFIEEKPSFIKEPDWKEYKDYLTTLQYIYILLDIHKYPSNALEVIEQYGDEIQKENEKLREIAYKIDYYEFVSRCMEPIYGSIKLLEKPSWMESLDYQHLDDIVTKIITAEELEKEAELKVAAVRDAIREERINFSKSPYLSEEEWDYLQKYIRNKNEMDENKANLRRKQRDLAQIEQKNLKQKRLLEKQLYIINEIFKDPSIVERIEDYSVPFKEGNFKNLLKLAEYLKRIK